MRVKSKMKIDGPAKISSNLLTIKNWHESSLVSKGIILQRKKVVEQMNYLNV